MLSSLVWFATWDHADVQVLCRIGPAPWHLRHLGDGALLCLAWTAQEALGVWAQVSQLEVMRAGELVFPFASCDIR